MLKKKLVFILVLLPFIGFAQANKLIRQGLRSENPKEQVELFSNAIELEPENFDAYFYRGVAKNNLGDFNGAILDYTKIIIFEPSADVYFNRGNSKYSLMDFTGAKEDYSKALKLNPDFIEARYSLAVTKNDLEDYKGAIVDLEAASNINITIPIIMQLARAYSGLKNYSKASEIYNVAVKVVPNEETYYQRGKFYMSINYYKPANEDFNAVINLNKDSMHSYFFRGLSYFFLGKYEEALSDFKVAVQFDLTDFDAIIGLAATYYKLGDLANSKQNFIKAKSLLMGLNPKQNYTIDLFKNTYWFEHQYFTFRELYTDLDTL
tara:strand:- start:10174 stop:11136 length:963 start_codon:yes stop_codon:yes gene_type:complete